MKSPLLLLLALCFYSNSFAQISSIDSFFLPGSIWRSEGHLQSSHMISNVYFSHRIERDSVINGYTYHLISGRDDARKGWSYDPMIYLNNDFGIFGGIRIDNRKAYFLQFHDVDTTNDLTDMMNNSWQLFVNEKFDVGVEKLIYDFDLPIGQTIPEKYLTSNSEDSVSLMNDSLRARRLRFGTESYEIEYWIDGIGSTHGIMMSLMDYPFFKLTCYEGATHSYPANMGWCLWANTSVNEMVVNGTEATIYPDPLQGDELQIKSDRTLKMLTITDMSGKVLAKHDLTQKEAAIRTSLTPGMYIIRLRYTDGTYLVQKLIKQ